ncbi:MAG TPA: RNA polymerase subunit sigma-70 [Eubacterium sp.]|nr:RNA polymerase subunit sigma-70 [Eubacterium sp.]
MTSEQFIDEYNRIYKDMYKLALYTLGNPEDAKDCVSDTVYEAYKNLHKLRDDSLFHNWIFKILSNRCKRYIGFLITRRERLTELPEDDGFASTSGDPLDMAIVKDALFTLSKKERLIVNMILIAGFNSREVAAELHSKDTTIRSTYNRALKKMQAVLDEKNGGKA